MAGEPGSRQTKHEEGLGIAIGLILAGAVAFWAPHYLQATLGWKTMWYILGGILGTIGMGGGLMEVAELQGRPGLGDWAVAAVFLGATGTLYGLGATGLVSGLGRGGLKLLTVVFGMIAALGFGIGLGKSFAGARRQPPSGDRSASKEVMAGIIALLGFATALVNFLAAGS